MVLPTVFTNLTMLLDVFNAVSSTIPLALIPKENSTFGAVIETNDLLRLPTTGKDIFVAGETTLSIQHCLLVRRGVRLEQIETILSHEQASESSRALLQPLIISMHARLWVNVEISYPPKFPAPRL
jgi:prephenate dehydratase